MKEYTSIKDIVPKERVIGLKRRIFRTENLGNGRVRVYYKNIHGQSPKPFVFPDKIELTERLAEAVGLYVGDGKLSKDLAHSEFTNRDSELSKFMFDFFLNLGVKLSDMTLSINYRNGNEGRIRQWWANKIGIKPDKFRISRSERCRYSALSIQINGVVFRMVLGNMIKSVMDLLMVNKCLRRGFLRGLFAAEGCIAVKEGYINHVTISYNPKTETKNRDFYRELFRIEGIPTYVMEYESSGDMIIRNWKNYYKLWNLKIANLCKRKRGRFKDIVRGLEVFCYLEDGFRKGMFKAFGMKQREIAKVLNSYQANISRNIQGVILLSVEQLIAASNFIGKKEFSIERIIENTSHIRVGRLTTIRNVRNDFLRTLFELKSN